MLAEEGGGRGCFVCSATTSKRNRESERRFYAQYAAGAKPMLLLADQVICASTQALQCYELSTGMLLHSFATRPFSVATIRQLQQPGGRRCLVTLEVRMDSESRAGSSGGEQLHSGWVEFGPLGGERHPAWCTAALSIEYAAAAVS